jgi:uncharacterized protein YndB with AHSA1/START domain
MEGSAETAARPTLDVSLPSDNEILMTRTFNAPRDVVWEAMTKPEHVRNWYGYREFTMPVCEMDVKIGGKWRYVSIAPNGDEIEFYGEYREIVPPERIVFTEIFAPFPDTESVVTSTFDEEDGVTTFRCRVWYPSKEVRDMVLGTGMEKGAALSYERLAEVIETLK